MIDHITIAVRDFGPAKAFYQAALAPLGLSDLTEGEGDEAYAGFGAGGKAFFWITAGDKPKGGDHVAFVVRTRAEVDAFYRAAISAGGRDNGAPGLRPHYHPNYYGAFIFDPDWNNIEAVCHSPG